MTHQTSEYEVVTRQSLDYEEEGYMLSQKMLFGACVIAYPIGHMTS